jgi:uncharacterized protein
MRRKDREIQDIKVIKEILDRADVCRIAIYAERAPYTVPLNYGYTWESKLTLFFHCAKDGRKIDLLKKNNIVGIEIDTAHELKEGKEACTWGMNYRSIIGIGKVLFIEDTEEKKKALDKIMEHYRYQGKPVYREEELKNVMVGKIEVEEMSGKEKK